MSSAAYSVPRRTFRGRGKAQDGNLPQRPHRRYQNQTKKTPPGKNQKYADDDARTAVERINDTDANDDTNIPNDSLLPCVTHELKHQKDEDETDQDIHINATSDDDDAPRSPNDTSNETNLEKAMKKEIKDLSKRIHNVRESIQLSANAISNPRIWEDNCLNAVLNCCRTWRSIINYYYARDAAHHGTHNNEGDNNDSSQDMKENEYHNIVLQPKRSHSYEINNTSLNNRAKQVALDIYGLIQMAMQTGPLVGSSPGYFKRCGSEVAQTALLFLRSLPLTIPAQPSPIVDKVDYEEQKAEQELDYIIGLIRHLGFTNKQLMTISKWCTNAEKAVKKDAPPSKSMSQKQNQYNKTRKPKNKSKKQNK